MKKIYVPMIAFLFFTLEANAQQDIKWKDRDAEPRTLRKSIGIYDRAAGIHNASNIGLFFENRGKLYPRRISDGPSGEYPINSGKNYIYRINPMVGIPGSVVQGRFTTNEEWEAVGGYQPQGRTDCRAGQGTPSPASNHRNAIPSPMATRLPYTEK